MRQLAHGVSGEEGRERSGGQPPGLVAAGCSGLTAAEAAAGGRPPAEELDWRSRDRGPREVDVEPTGRRAAAVATDTVFICQVIAGVTAGVVLM
jgi:hypothetical protein